MKIPFLERFAIDGAVETPEAGDQ